jgi:hypothetical protein
MESQIYTPLMGLTLYTYAPGDGVPSERSAVVWGAGFGLASL